MADGQAWLEAILRTERWSPAELLSGMKDGLGEAGRELLPNSEFLKALNQRGRPQSIRYHSGAGSRGLLSAECLRRLRDKFDPDAPDTPDMFKVITADELQDGSGDGAVTIQSALFHDADSKKIFERNHMQLIQVDADRPESYEVFLWIVETLDWDRVDVNN